MKSKRLLTLLLSISVLFINIMPTYANINNNNDYNTHLVADSSRNVKTLERGSIWDHCYNKNNVYKNTSKSSLGNWSNSDTCYGDTLIGTEKTIYNFLVNNVTEASTNEFICTLSNEKINKSTFSEALFYATFAFAFDYPERFWGDYFTVTDYYNTTKGSVATIVWASEYYTNASIENSKMYSLESAANSIINEMNNAPNVHSNADKAAYIHNWLIDNVEYTQGAPSKKENPDPHNAYGAIVNHSAVCEGYSLAFTLLCKKANIIAPIIIGYHNGNHSWNNVKLSGEYFFLDVTNDDTGYYHYKHFLTPFPSSYEVIMNNRVPMTSNNFYIKYGDVDQDNRFTATDAALVAQYSLRPSDNISEIGLIASDVTGDGNIKQDDSDEIFKKCMDSMYELPVYTILNNYL